MAKAGAGFNGSGNGQQGQSERYQFAGSNDEGNSGACGGQSCDPGNHLQVMAGGEHERQDNECDQDACASCSRHRLKTHCRFPEHGRENESGGDGVGHTGKSIASACTPDHPEAAVENGNDQDGEFGNGAGFCESAEHESSGKAEDSFSDGGEGAGRGFEFGQPARRRGPACDKRCGCRPRLWLRQTFGDDKRFQAGDARFEIAEAIAELFDD